MFIFGWRNDPAAVQKVLATLPMPFFASSAAHLKGTGEKKTVLLYKAYKDLFGSHMPAHYQRRGMCLKQGTEVKMACGKIKEIQDVMLGEEVISHTNTPRKVIEVSSKYFTGKYYYVTIQGCNQQLHATNEHKILTVASNDQYIWKKIEDLTIEDYILVPYGIQNNELQELDVSSYFKNIDLRLEDNKVLIKNAKKKYPINRFIKIDEKFARLIGLYLAEGSSRVQKDRNYPDRTTFTYNLHKERHLAEETQQLLKEIFDVDSSIIENKVQSTIIVRANYCTLGHFLEEFCGKHTLTKRIPSVFFKSPENVKRTLLNAWLDGDGHFTGTQNVGTTSSAGLYKDVFSIAISCNIVPTSYLQKQYSHQNAPANKITFKTDDNVLLVTNSKVMLETKYGYGLKVKNITFEEVTNLKVYDIGVEEDHSFIAEGFAVHNCVAHGWSRTINTLQCVQIKQGASLEYKPVSHSAIYGMSRQYGNDLNWQDGSVGAWAAAVVSSPKGGVVTQQYIKDKGYAPNENYNQEDCDELARQWAAKGVPQEVWDECKKISVQTVSLVDKADEVRDATCNGYPVAVASNQGFTMRRDSKGRCIPSGTWNHEMAVEAFDADLNRFLISQSWGQNVPEGPLYLDQPDNTFWIDYDVMDRMARQGDTFAISNFQGFPTQTIDWYI